MRRLPVVAGEWIRRSEVVRFAFEGEPISGYAGDTITSAVLAEGHPVLARSFKYHRRRGPLSAANHDANLVMQVDVGGRSIPNVRADVTSIRDGVAVRAVNTRGGVRRDLGAVTELFSSFLPVGFYYKAFHSKRLFPLWERMFRSMTGLGSVDLGTPQRKTPKRYDFTDILVVGGGPSGLSAALGAANRGASVLLVDENLRVGGSGHYVRHARDSRERTQQLVEAVGSHPRIRVLTETVAAGYYADHWVALAMAECMVKVRARAVVIAQGAFEQPAVFRGNDLPGVMLASAAQRLMARYAVAPANRIAIVTANDQGYGAALDASDAGIDVGAILDLRESPGPGSQALARDARLHGVRLVTGVRPHAASRDRAGRITSLSYQTAGAPGVQHVVDIDGLWMSVGFAPVHGLLHQAGARMRYERSIEQFLPETLPPGIFACGKANGHYGFGARVADGERAGALAAAHGGFEAAVPSPVPLATDESPSHEYPIFPHPKGKEFVDFDEDLQIRDFENAVQEGFDSAELLKRYTTAGMGPSQGKHSNMNALRILARLRGEDLHSHALTTARPMFHPVLMSHLAGRGFQPERRTPVDAEHAALQAVWMPAANWRRPEYYAVAGKSRAQAIAAEIHAVRNGVGLIDVGTLGKVEAHGPVAGEFLDRVYTARFSNLKVGMTRYGLMLDEAGIVIDDGVIARVGPESFYFTTTTGNSGTLFREFGRLATLWGLPVGLVNLTGHYAAFNLAGPASRDVLRSLTAIDLSDDAFPYLGLREGHVAGVPCRLMRVGFVGELGFEIHVPSEYGVALWRALLQAGQAAGIRPFGVEAQRMLRLEKGHLIIGQDSDGTTNALELNAPWAIKMDKPFFIGQRSLQVHAKRPPRQVLVGFRLPPGSGAQLRESHLVIHDGQIAGRVTSVGSSPTLGHVIGLALVDPAVAATGHLAIRTARHAEVDARVTELPFYDPHGERQQAGVGR
jgi:sarcosine oxidase subunit alpha